MELYNAIRLEDLPIPPHTDPQLTDLLCKLFEKDPDERIKMQALREHPWVTRNGEDMLLSIEENTADFIPQPTEEEMASAITKNIRNIMTVVKAVRKLKRLTLARFKSPTDCRPTLSTVDDVPRRTKSADLEDRRPFHQMLQSLGLHGDLCLESAAQALPEVPQPVPSIPTEIESTILASDKTMQDVQGQYPSIHVVGESYDALSSAPDDPANSSLIENQHLQYLDIGAGTNSTEPQGGTRVVCESPQPTTKNIYEEAWRANVERIQREQGPSATIYSTKWVDGK